MKLKSLFILLLLLAAGGSAFAQGFRFDSTVTSQGTIATVTNAVVIPANPQIAFCNFPANAVPCTNKATTYTSQTLVTPCSTSTQIVLVGTSSCVASPDAQDNWGVWVPAGMYAYTITLSGGVNLGPYVVTLFPTNGNYTMASLTVSGTATACKVNGTRLVDTANTCGWAGSEFGAWVNAAAADVGKGIIKVAPGSYTMSTGLNFDNLTGVKLRGAGGWTGGVLGATSVTWTGSTTRPISLRSSTDIEIGWIQWLWNNAAFTGDFVFSGWSAVNTDTGNLWIHDCSFFKSGSGVNITNILNLDKTISSEIGPHNNFNNANVAILGANTNTSYANVIHVHDNHFSSSTGTIVQAMIRNLTSGSEINANTFEMGSGAGSPFVIDTNVQVNDDGMDFHGNWVGDVGAAYNGTLFNFAPSNAANEMRGIAIHGNIIGGNSAATVTFFNINGSVGAVNGFEVSGNSLLSDGANVLFAINGGSGIKIGANEIRSSPAIVTALSLSGTINALEFTGNGWSGTPTTFLSGAPTSGVIYSVTNSPTYYGNYRQINGDMTFNGITTFVGNPILNSSGFQLFPGGFNITGGASNLPAATTSTLRCIGNGSPVLGACYIGDGTGYQFNLRKRTGSVDTDLFAFKDNGQFQSFIATGTAPYVIASTTPVANLTVSNHPIFEICGTTTTCAKTQQTATIVLNGGPIALVAGTITITSLPFTSSTSYVCSADDSTGINGIDVVYVSGSSVTFNGTGTDSIRYACQGN